MQLSWDRGQVSVLPIFSGYGRDEVFPQDTDLSPVPPNKLKYLQHKNNTHSTYYSILSSFYIKPQLARWSHLCVAIVSYRLSTSNHNLYSFKASSFSLYLIVFLHQTTTSFNTTAGFRKLYLIVFLHQTTTTESDILRLSELYLIVFLHQTTTVSLNVFCLFHCILSSFYIKPQLSSSTIREKSHCILSSFYIKPQLCRCSCLPLLYCILSSFYIKPQLSFLPFLIHRYCILSSFYIKPQLLNLSTTNLHIVSYRLSTSNHNSAWISHVAPLLYLIVFLHQTTTVILNISQVLTLYLIVFLHQTTTRCQFS